MRFGVRSPRFARAGDGPVRRAGVVAMVALLVIGATVAGAWRVQGLQQEARQAQAHFSAAQAALSGDKMLTEAASGSAAPNQLGAACTEAVAADTALRDLNGEVQVVMPLIGALEAVPGVGGRARSQAASLEAGTQLAAAGVSLCEGLGPLTTLLSTNTAARSTGGQSTAQVLQGLAAARPRLLDALVRFGALRTSLGAIQDSDLDEVSRASVAALRTRLPKVTSTLREATVLLDLLGADAPHRYLLVSQNPDELRATGGYIGSAGVVEVSGGTVRLLEYGSSRAYDTPPDVRVIPPDLFQPYLGAGYLELAGANWWPSFPDVARQLVYLYGLSHPGTSVDGVVALDQFGLKDVLQAVGPVEVPDYGERVAAEDLQAKVDMYVHQGEDEAGRKQFMAALSQAVLQRVLTSPRAVLPELVRAVHAALDDQHLLVWTARPEAAELFAIHRWDGGLLPASGDALMLVDTNVASSKQSQEVRRDTNYRVDLTDIGAPVAHVDVRYTNDSRPERRPGHSFVPTYRTFLRVFAPSGAQLEQSGGFVGSLTTGTECGRSFFAGEVLVPQGATVEASLDYQLPPAIVAGGAYELLLQQQPGVPPGHVAVAVKTRGETAVATLSDDAAGQHARWRLNLDETTPRLETAPLPSPTPGGCGVPLIQATQIAAPTRIDIPAADVSADVVELGVGRDGVMESPPTPDVVGWYRMSARAGQPGNLVMSGHVDWDHRAAVFWGLRGLGPGDRIDIRGTDGIVHTYAVEWNRVFGADSAPVAEMVGGSNDSLLTLITCDGVFDRSQRQYSDRRIVRARLTQ